MKIPKIKVGSPILIVWDDAFKVTDHYWAMESELSQIKPMQTLGYYVKHNNRFFTVAQTFSRADKGEFDEFGGTFSIPVGCITSIKQFK